MAGKGSAIVYGRIQIVSDAAPVSELRAILKQILAEEGYPESSGMKSRDFDDEDEKIVDQEDVLDDESEIPGEELTDEEESSIEEEEEEEAASVKTPPWMRNGRKAPVRKKG